MAADASLLQLEGVLGDTAATPAACCVASKSCESSSSPSAVLTEGEARKAAMEAAAQAASLSERCRSLLPRLKESFQSTSSSTHVQSEEDDSTRGSPASSSCTKGPCSAAGSGETPQKGTYLELESDEEGPMIELVVGVGVLDVKGQVPSDARLAEMGVQVVELPADSPVLQDSASTTGQPLDALQRALATRKQSDSKGPAPIVSVLSSGSSSEGESDDSDDEPERDQPVVGGAP